MAISCDDRCQTSRREEFPVNWMDRLNERAELMGRMLETLGAMKGLPEGEKAVVELETAARLCMSCEEAGSCQKWLDSNPDGAELPLKVCLNAATFKNWMNN